MRGSSHFPFRARVALWSPPFNKCGYVKNNARSPWNVRITVDSIYSLPLCRKSEYVYALSVVCSAWCLMFYWCLMSDVWCWCRCLGCKLLLMVAIRIQLFRLKKLSGSSCRREQMASGGLRLFVFSNWRYILRDSYQNSRYKGLFMFNSINPVITVYTIIRSK